MKKFVRCGIAAAVVVAAGFAAYQSYGYYGLQDNSLLMQNVEALADDDNGDAEGDPSSGNNKEKTCGQKTKYYGADGAAKCPNCHMSVGFFGTKYSYQKNGNLTSYKEGFVGKEVVCSPYCGTTKYYSAKDLVTKSCN